MSYTFIYARVRLYLDQKVKLGHTYRPTLKFVSQKTVAKTNQSY